MILSSFSFHLRASVGNGTVSLCLRSGEHIAVDHVVVAVGLQPNVELAEKAQLELDPVHVCSSFLRELAHSSTLRAEFL